MPLQHILVAEDEFIIAEDLCQTVTEAGYAVEGPHADLSSAMLALQKRKPDLAILDVNLIDGEVYPLAEKLMQEDVPVIFHSGRVTPADVEKLYPDAFACAKPCPPSEMIETMHQALAAH